VRGMLTPMLGLIILQAYMHSYRGLAGEHINGTLSKLRGSMVVRARGKAY